MKLTDEENNTVYDMKGVHFTLDVIELFLKTSGRFTLSGFAKSLCGANKNKVFRVLSTLESRNFISRNNRGEYTLGGSAFHMAQKIFASGVTQESYLPVLQKIAGASHEAVYLGVLNAGELFLRDMVDSVQAVRVASCIGCSYRPSREISLPKQYVGRSFRLYIDNDAVTHGVTALTAVIDSSHLVSSLALVMLVPGFRAEPKQLEKLIQIISAEASDFSKFMQLATPGRSLKEMQVQERVTGTLINKRCSKNNNQSSRCSTPYRKAEVNHGRANV